MLIKTANYVGSFPSERQCPEAEKPEYAFIGRSNVGKSSLINMLCHQKELAKVSRTPGKTQLINYFLINEQWYLVDLPGYGYARVSKRQRQKWEKMIEGYLLKRNSLGCAFVLIDATIPPQQIDIEFMNWMGKMRIPFVIVFTKTDRQRPAQKMEHISAFRNEMLKYWNEIPQQFVTSSKVKEGRDEILNFIETTNQMYLVDDPS
ncbi:MAG: ribosome biogenesis GTP-binding protein YihA/YsxC [Bacteroidota bacterium]